MQEFCEHVSRLRFKSRTSHMLSNHLNIELYLNGFRVHFEFFIWMDNMTIFLRVDNLLGYTAEARRNKGFENRWGVRIKKVWLQKS